MMRPFSDMVELSSSITDNELVRHKDLVTGSENCTYTVTSVSELFILNFYIESDRKRLVM